MGMVPMTELSGGPVAQDVADRLFPYLTMAEGRTCDSCPDPILMPTGLTICHRLRP